RDAGVGVGVVVEAHHRVAGQVGLPGAQVEAGGVLAVVAVDEQQPNLRAAPALGLVDGEPADHGDVVGVAGLVDLPDSVEPNIRVLVGDGAGPEAGGGPVPRQIVRVDRPHVGAH